MNAAAPQGNDHIVTGSHVTLHYRLCACLNGQERELINTFDSRPVTVQVGSGQLAQGMEDCLIGLAAGSEHSFELSADQAYGPRSDQRVQALSRATFDQHSETGSFGLGDPVELRMPQGGRLAGVIKHYDERRVVVDFNHPLAGVPLRWSVKEIGRAHV